MGIFGALFDVTGFPARWHCGRWSDLHGWLHISADLAVFGANVMTLPADELPRAPIAATVVEGRVVYAGE